MGQNVVHFTEKSKPVLLEIMDAGEFCQTAKTNIRSKAHSQSMFEQLFGLKMIWGFLDSRYEPPAPFLRATVSSKELGLRHVVNFHVDTGAAVTTLLDKDIKRLKIDVSKFREADRARRIVMMNDKVSCVRL